MLPLWPLAHPGPVLRPDSIQKKDAADHDAVLKHVE
jgi:hypothetical protein